MNERIKELAEQAGCSIDGMGYGEGNVEKFAELIVKECIGCCEQVISDPVPENVAKYRELYEQYRKLGKFIEFEGSRV